MSATLLGRLETDKGPTPILVKGGEVFDISKVSPTVADWLAAWDGSDVATNADDVASLGTLESLGLSRRWDESGTRVPRLLAPVDLQCVKACGVTFAVSAMERVIEERARGEASAAEEIRGSLSERIGGDLRSVTPGSDQAAKLKDALIADGLWSQYLEVAIGPHAEVFTKAPVLSSVGWGDWVGVRSDSDWNNPEPEIVLIVDAKGRPCGAALGNDVNLRDLEGRSALLLGEAKDNNASCAIGPFIRLFDREFTLEDVKSAEVNLEIEGADGFTLHGVSTMRDISRPPEALISQALEHHQYPDGFTLFMGTLFAPVEDRDVPGGGFTHKPGDIVRVSSDRLGCLENKVTTCNQAPPWTFGVSALMRNLAARGLLRTA